MNNDHIHQMVLSIPESKKGSSETLRKETFSFSAFCKESPESTSDPNFLTWFCGFVEGDGSLISSKNRPYFFVIQKDPKVLYWIKQQLQFGSVQKHGEAFRYAVSARSQIYKLLLLFEGNFLLEKRKKQLDMWYPHFHHCSKSFQKDEKYPNFLTNSWLSGFTDAEGCFSVYQVKDNRYKRGYRLRFRYILDQKGEKSLMESIGLCIGGGKVSLRVPKEKELYRYEV